jgi:ligand-binding SRPBCC domain-containing protein
MPVFESRTPLNATSEQVFEYILQPANLQAIAPPETQFVFVNPPQVIVLGSRLTCKVQAYGMVQQLSYEIVEPNPEGGVSLINRIEFEPPGGLIGFIVTADKILDALEDGFHHRRKVLQKIFA